MNYLKVLLCNIHGQNGICNHSGPGAHPLESEIIEAELRIYVLVKHNSIVSDNGLSPGRNKAIIWTNAGILLIGPLGTNFSGIIIETYMFSFKKMHLKMSIGKWRPFSLGLNLLMKSDKHDNSVLLI